MGLSSSQARLLNLTSRMHQIEYKAAKIEAEKLQMANESRRVYLDYQEALEQTKIQIKTIQSDASATYVDITKWDQLSKAGYALIVHNVPVGDNALEDRKCESAKAFADALSTKYYGETGKISDSNLKTLLINAINMGDVSFIQKRTKPGPDGTGLGDFPSPDDNDYADWISSVATNTSFQEVDDEAGLRKAEAKYEADMRRIDMKDRKFDYDLAALDAERNAVKQEMETLKTVAKDNVDRTFKLFS